MKHINSKITLMLVSVLLSFWFTSCKDEKTYMEVGVVDMNGNIASVSKSVAQPGDILTITGTGLDKVYKIML